MHRSMNKGFSFLLILIVEGDTAGRGGGLQDWTVTHPVALEAQPSHLLRDLFKL